MEILIRNKGAKATENGERTRPRVLCPEPSPGSGPVADFLAPRGARVRTSEFSAGAPKTAREGARAPLFRRPRAPAIFLGTLLALAVGWIAGASPACAQAPLPAEYQVKAAFLINFAKYADWPAEAFAGASSPIVIAVLGETRVTEEVQKVIAGRTANGRKIVLKRLASGEETGVCHILFISVVEQQHSPGLLARLREAGVLTVGESDDFLERGGIINLARREQKVALEVNLTAAGQARIKLSSKLLSVAETVKGKAK